MRARFGWILAATAATACGSASDGGDDVGEPPFDPFGGLIDDRPVTRAAKPPPPIMGGTLLVLADGSMAIASDPDRDVVHLVDLQLQQEVGVVELEEGALPFRAVEDAQGLVHITLRGTSKVLTIDPQIGEVQQRGVCWNPRGIAYNPGSDDLHVACAGGELLTLPAAGGPITNRVALPPDVRDVVVDSNGRLFVSTFRSASVIEVLSDGTLGSPRVPFEPQNDFTSGTRAPNTAWRTVAMPGGGWAMIHQHSSTKAVDIPDEDDEDEGDEGPGTDEGSASAESGFDDSGDGGAGYGGGAFGDPCGSIVTPVLSMVDPTGVMSTSGTIAMGPVVVDVAPSPDGKYLAVVSPSADADSPIGFLGLSIGIFDTATFAPGPLDDCGFPNPLPAFSDFVAVAWTPGGRVVAQTRDPARLHVLDPEQGELAFIVLAGERVEDTGHDLFHLDTGAGIACASCHAEGGDDGHVWRFKDHGKRRTQPLDVGLQGTAPFHWKGDMDNIAMIAHEVRERRMGGLEQTDERVGALRDWVFQIPLKAPVRSSDDDLAAQGRAIFSASCASCHGGSSFTDNRSVDLGGGEFQVPPLRGVALRPPYMHDGRSKTLEAAVIDMLQVSPGGSDIDSQGIDALVAYLETL